MGLSYRNFYGLHELAQINMVTNFRMNKIPMSLGINRFGNKFYQEYQFHSGISCRFSDEAALGIGVQYYQLQITNYGSQGSWGINMGISYCLLNNFTVGMLVTNINQPVIGKCQEKLPQSLSLGFCYVPLQSLKIGFAFYRDIKFDQSYRIGISYDIYKSISLGLGIDDQTNTFSIFIKYVADDATGTWKTIEKATIWAADGNKTMQFKYSGTGATTFTGCTDVVGSFAIDDYVRQDSVTAGCPQCGCLRYEEI